MTAEQAIRARRARAQVSNNTLDDDETREQSLASYEKGDGAESGEDDNQSRSSNMTGIALGAFSIGLGLAEIVMPRTLARMVGIKPTAFTSTTFRLFGLREIAAGIGMVLQPQRQGWAWARVAGDALDFAALTRAGVGGSNQRWRVNTAAAAVLSVTAVDLVRARQLGPRRKPRAERSMESDRSAAVEVRRSISIKRSVEEVYAFWRDFANLPRFMKHLESVTVNDEHTSEWKAKAPAGMSVSWTAELVEDQLNSFISWQSVEGSQVQNSGSVRFEAAPGDRGTEVHVALQYTPPAGKLGRVVAKMFGEEPMQQVSDDLRRFKQVLETGEILLSDASLHSGMHPAQPSEEPLENAPFEGEQKILINRAADALNQSSNRDRDLAPALQRSDDWYNNELANERSTF